MSDDNAREALGLLKDEDPKAYLILIAEAHEEIEDERKGSLVKAKLDALEIVAKEGKMTLKGGLVIRWGIITGGESDLMRGVLIETAERNAKLQQQANARKAAIRAEMAVIHEPGSFAHDEACAVAGNGDKELYAIGLKINRENATGNCRTAALTIKGMGGCLTAHNPDAEKCSEWPPLDLDDYRQTIDARVAILREIATSQQQELFAALRIHQRNAGRLSGDESGN